MIVKELLTRLGFELDEKKLKEYEEMTNGAVRAMKGLAIVTGAAVAALGELMRESGEFGEQMEIAATATRMTTDQLQKWDYLARSVGLNFQDVTHAIQMTSAKAGEALLTGGESLRAFYALGLSFQDLKDKNPDQLVFKIVEGLSKIKSTSAQSALGIMTMGRGYQELLPIIRKGPEAIREAFAEFDRLGLGLTETEVHNLARFSDGMTDLRAILGSIRNQIAAQFAPALDDAIARFKDWWAINKEIVKTRVYEFVELTVTGLWMLIKVGAKAVEIAAALAKHVGGVENAFKLLAIAWIGVRIGEVVKGIAELTMAFKLAKTEAELFALWADAIPLAVGAAIGAVILLIQDFIGWQSGKGRSVFGHFLGPYSEFDKQFGNLFSKERGMRLGMQFGYALGQGIWLGLGAAGSAFAKGGEDFFSSLFASIKDVFKGDPSTPLPGVLGMLGFSRGYNAYRPLNPTPTPPGWHAPMQLQPEINIYTLPGTTQEQANQIGAAAASGLSDAWSKIQRDFPQTEYGQ